MKKVLNEWGDNEDFGLDQLDDDRVRMMTVQGPEKNKSLTREEEKELNDALKYVIDTPKNTSMIWGVIFALFMLFAWPLIWVFVAHFIFHF